MVSARELVGRRIVAFDPGAYKDEYEGGKTLVTMHKPTITLDDGSVLHFTVEESPRGADYGVSIQKRK